MNRLLSVTLIVVLLATVSFVPTASASNVSSTKMYWFGTDPLEKVIGSSSKLVRSADGVELEIKTKGLNVGHIYTFWWVLFEDGPDAPTSVFWGGYFIPDGKKGHTVVKATLQENTLPDPPAQIRVETYHGLQDAETAEIHLPLVDHGPPIPGHEVAQKYTFEGGCGEPINSAPCPIQQFTIHVK